MHGRDFFKITSHTIEPKAAITFVAGPTQGAADFFIGTVRDLNLGRAVTGVSYDVFEELGLNVFKALAIEARQRWGEALHIYIEHYKGRLDVGGISILISVSSPHRDESFKACRYLLEEIKHRAPIWKQEHYIDGNSEWVQGHALCSHGPSKTENEEHACQHKH